jgi:hypothetical protein
MEAEIPITENIEPIPEQTSFLGMTPEQIASHITGFDENLLAGLFLAMFGSFFLLLFI